MKELVLWRHSLKGWYGGEFQGLAFLNEVRWRTQPKLIPPLFQEALSGMWAIMLLFSMHSYPASTRVTPGYSSRIWITCPTTCWLLRVVMTSLSGNGHLNFECGVIDENAEKVFMNVFCLTLAGLLTWFWWKKKENLVKEMLHHNSRG